MITRQNPMGYDQLGNPHIKSRENVVNGNPMALKLAQGLSHDWILSLA